MWLALPEGEGASLSLSSRPASARNYLVRFQGGLQSGLGLAGGT